MLTEYLFKRIHRETSLIHIKEVRQSWIDIYKETYYPGATLYWRQSSAPKTSKTNRRYKTERWYAYTDKAPEAGALNEVLSLLTTLPFTRSLGDKGEDIPPVILPIKRPVGRPRKIIIPLRQIVVCHDLQLIAKIRGE